MYCPDCETFIDKNMQAWAYKRFRKWACANCGWIGEKMKTPPLIPRDVSPVRGYVRKVA